MKEKKYREGKNTPQLVLHVLCLLIITEWAQNKERKKEEKKEKERKKERKKEIMKEKKEKKRGEKYTPASLARDPPNLTIEVTAVVFVVR